MILKRFKSLDVLRGFAALSVFLTHFGPIKLPYLHQFFSNFQSEFLWCSEGLHWGVVLFLVLSGFSIHMQQVNSTKFNISHYFKRRFYRIYPVLITAILLGYIVDFYFNHRLISQYFINFFFNGLLFTGILPLEPLFGNRIMDTAIVEFLIYISYPFIFRYFKRNMIFVFLLFFLIHILNFGLTLTKVELSWVQRNFFRLALYWWMGAIFAELVLNSDPKYLKVKKYFQGILPLFIGYVFYYSVSHLINFKGSHIFKSFLVALVGGILISTFVEQEYKSNFNKKFYGFEYLGLASYSLYAIHVPVIYLINNSTTTQKLGQITTYYLIWISVIGITILTYLFIEKPFHKIARR